jgi:hypothetical protein
MNIFKSISYNFKRLIYWNIQTLFFGYNDCDLWGLDYHLAKVILKRLKAFRKMKKNGTPMCINPDDNLTDEERIDKWNKIIDTMIWSFEYVTVYGYGTDYPCVYITIKEPDSKAPIGIPCEDNPKLNSFNPDWLGEYKFDEQLHNELYDRYKLGMNNFAKYFCNLWD